MERVEGNNKIVLKVLSTLLIMYIVKCCHDRYHGDLCSIGTAGWHYYRKTDENETFFVGNSDRRSIFCRAVDWFPVDEPGNFQ